MPALLACLSASLIASVNMRPFQALCTLLGCCNLWAAEGVRVVNKYPQTSIPLAPDTVSSSPDLPLNEPPLVSSGSPKAACCRLPAVVGQTSCLIKATAFYWVVFPADAELPPPPAPPPGGMHAGTDRPRL
jgi:hypothetical protein